MTAVFILLALAAAPVQLEPPSLTLGKESEVALVLVVPGAKSVTAISANGVGVLSAAERVADGRFRTRFSFPKERIPQLVLIRVEIEAEGRPRSRQWIALPLIASADLKIETKPRAIVTVTIGEKTFGPAVADARGKVTIAAQVPPGFATATVLAVDRAGNRTTQPLDLGGQPFARAAAVLDAADVTPDHPVQLEIFAIEPDGRPLTRTGGLRLTAKLGSIEPPVARVDGVFVATYRAPTAVSTGHDTVVVAVEGTTVVTELEVKLKAGAPARLVLTFTPPAYTAGSGLACQLSAQALDSQGNAVPTQATAFTADFGTLEATSDGGAVLRVPDDFAGRAAINVHATSSDTSGDASLPLIAGAATQAFLTFPSPIVAGELARGELTLSDAFGNSADHASVTAATTTGRAARVTNLGGGRYELELNSDPSDAPGDHQLQVTANGQPVGAASLVVLRYQRRWALSVGLMAFVQTNFTQWTKGGPRLSVGLRMGRTQLHVVLEGTYGGYVPIASARPVDRGMAAFDIDLEEFSVLGGARYWIPLGPRSSLHLSLVGGLQRTWAGISKRGVKGSTISEVTSGLAIRAAGGLAFYLGFGQLVTQLEYTLAPGAGLVQGNLGGLGVGLGYVASF